MELDNIKDAFDRVSKKQKLSSSKLQEVIDQVGHEIDQALAKLQSTSSSIDQKSVMVDLKTQLGIISPQNQLDGSQKELNINISRYPKLLEKSFIPDISRACRNVDFDFHTVNQIIANHFYRQGLFDIGDCLINEARESDDITTLKSQFMEMYQIVNAMKARNLSPAINWTFTNRDKLEMRGSNLELKLHQLQFIEILQKGTRGDALDYVRAYLAPFAAVHMVEIQKLMACLLWTGRLDSSPYAELMSPSHWEKLTEELTRQFCSLLGQPYESPLSLAVAAGFEGLPTLLKLANVMAAKKLEWEAMKQLPVPVDLRREFQFHSIFVCPVSRDQASEDNPPMLMPCGHVLCRQSILKLSKSSMRTFKCPYCPANASIPQCKQIYF